MAWGSKQTHPDPVVEESVPVGVRIAGAWSWRALVVVGVIAVFIWLVTVFSEILIPFLVGIVVSALLVPISNWLQRHHVPKWLAVVMSLLGGIAALGGMIWLVVDRLDTPMWVAFVVAAGVWVAGTVAVRLLRRRSAAPTDA